MRFFEAFYHVSKNFGLPAAWSLIAGPRIGNRIPGINISYAKRLRDYLRKDLKDIILKYKSEPLIPGNRSVDDEKRIFSLWWQGSDNMPKVVTDCRKSLARNSGNCKLIALDRHNISQYIDIPDYIYKKLEKSEISITQISDLIRVMLLAEYGGVWIDACIYVLSPIDFNYSLESPRIRQNNSNCMGKWIIGVLSAPRGHKLMRFMSESLMRYWQRHKIAVDYLMMDSFMMIAYEEFSDIRAEIDRFKISSPDIHEARYLFDKPVDYNIFNSLITNNQFLSLTWRIDYPDEIEGKKTYYGALKDKLGSSDHACE